jgi:4-methyl-5(b-hydroxyethyl)-thiazole monophosphate biosynthesis
MPLTMAKKRVLLPLGEGFEEIEAIVPMDLLRRGDVEVVAVALERAAAVTGAHGISVGVGGTVGECSMAAFDALLLPGGAAVGALRKNPDVARLVRETVQGGKLLAAICAAPLLLHDLGLLENRRFTAYPSVLEGIPGRDGNAAVVEDGDLITASGPGAAAPFALAILRRLRSRETAEHVAEVAGFSLNFGDA